MNETVALPVMRGDNQEYDRMLHCKGSTMVGKHRKFSSFLLTSCLLLWGGLHVGCSSSSGDLACTAGSGVPRQIDEAKLYFEFQSTDNDTGIHGMFDSSGFSELCISGPEGGPFLAVKPQGTLGAFALGGIFFESREPKASEMSQQEVLDLFPAGNYDLVGTAFNGDALFGSAVVSHDIPAPPRITAPAEGALVDPNDLVIRWDPVTETIDGDPLTLVGYEVIVTNEDKDGADPNGMSHPIMSTHVVPSVSSLTVPPEFLEPATEYELEIIAIEESGNQTITVLFFDTP